MVLSASHRCRRPAWAVLLAFGSAVFARAAPPADVPAFCRAQAATLATPGQAVFTGVDGWLFLAAELRHLGVTRYWGSAAATVSAASRPEWADPLPAILDFKAQLDGLGIELLMVPVPAKAAIYADRLAPGLKPEGAAPADAAFLALLRSHGIAVLDLTPLLLAERQRGADLLYCRTDTHWSPRACAQAAAAIAASVTNRPWAAAASGSYSRADGETAVRGDLSALLGRPAEDLERLPLVEISGDPVISRDSPVLLMGDSHCLVFHEGGDLHATGAGLPDHLAAGLRMPVDLLATRGSGATAARQNVAMRSRADPAYLSRKKLIIWCFASRELTQSVQGWRPLRLTPKAAEQGARP